MSIEETTEILIEQYLRGELTPADQLVFEAELEINPDLKEQFELNQMCFDTFETKNLHELNAMVDDYKSRTVVKQKLKKISVFSLVGLGVIAGSLYMIKGRNGSVPNETKNEMSHEIVSDKSEALDRKELKQKIFEVEKLLKEETPKPKVLPSNHSSSLPKKEKVVTELKSKEEPLKENLQEVFEEDVLTLASEEKSINNNVIQEQLEEVKETTDQTVAYDPCLEKPEVTVEVQHFYLNEYEEGSLLINSDEDLEFSLNSGTYEETSSFTDLTHGNFALSAKNQEGCVFDLGSFKVKKIDCTRKKTYTFNRASMSLIEIPISESFVEITIFSQDGRKVNVSESEFNDSFEWNGTDMTGNYVESGLYKVSLESKNHKCFYNVVIAK